MSMNISVSGAALGGLGLAVGGVLTVYLIGRLEGANQAAALRSLKSSTNPARAKASPKASGYPVKIVARR